jgi:GNAT superfamily N-acetyltransferase
VPKAASPERAASAVRVEPYRPALDAGVRTALDAAFGGWGSEARWRWKQPDRPGFVPQDVWVATAGEEEVVGCYSTTVLPVRLGDGVVVPFSFDGDLAVPPAQRGRGIPAAIRDASERWAFAQRVPLRGGFTTEGLNARVYNPLYGLTFFPVATTEFRKALGLGQLRRHIALVGDRLLARSGMRAALARRPLVVNLSVDSLGDGHVVLAAEGFRLEEGTHPSADLAVRLPLVVVASGRDGNLAAMARTTVREAARGRVRIRGLIRSGPALVRLAAALIRGG